MIFLLTTEIGHLLLVAAIMLLLNFACWRVYVTIAQRSYLINTAAVVTDELLSDFEDADKFKQHVKANLFFKDWKHIYENQNRN